MTVLSKRSFALASTLSLAAFAVLIALGAWQVSRLKWKESLIQTIESRVNQAPRALETWYKTEPGTDYWPVRVTGTFRHESERHFFATHKGASGYFVYTPLEISPNAFVFVNRGFVPFDRKDATTRKDGQTVGLVTLEGLARSVLTEKPSSMVPDNDPAKNQFYWKDLAAMTASASLPKDAIVVEAFIDASASATPAYGLPQGGVTLVDLPNNHLQYAVTWFGLAATLAGVWLTLALRQRAA